MTDLPVIRTATFLDAIVRLTAEARCPNCGTPLRPHDFEPLEHGDWRLVCTGCHIVLFEIENR